MYNARDLYKLIIDTNGNPSVSQLVSIGISEGNAIEMIMRLTNANRNKVIENARKLLGG